MTKLQIVVCVTCVGGRLIYDIVRALRDAEDYEIRVVGTDADESAAGRLLCDEFVVLPMAECDPEGWVAGILELKPRFGLDGLICLSDQEARLAAKNRERLKDAGIQTSVSRLETVTAMTDKLLLLEKLQSGGLDVGPFMAVDSRDEALDAMKQLGYPNRRIVLKPRWGRGSRGVLVCDSDAIGFKQFLPDRFCGSGSIEDVVEKLERLQIPMTGMLAVPYWDGPVFDVECLVSSGKVVMSAARRRQLRNPFWPTSTGHQVDMDQRIIGFAQRMCEILGVDGAADFDIVLRNDGTPAPFDASARFSGSVGGSYNAGANFLAQLVRVMFNLPLASYQIRDRTPLRPFVTLSVVPDANSDELL